MCNAFAARAICKIKIVEHNLSIKRRRYFEFSTLNEKRTLRGEGVQDVTLRDYVVTLKSK